MTLPAICERFLDYQGTIRNLSPDTLAAYRMELSMWVAYLREHRPERDVLTVEREDVESYLFWRKRNKKQVKRSSRRRPANSNTELSISALRRTASTLSSFYTWAIKQRHMSTSPTVGIELGKRPKRVAMPFQKHELRRLLEIVLQPPQDNLNLQAWELCWRRDQAMIMVMAHQGLRRSEVSKLSWRDVDWEMREMIVNGKGNKQRRLPMHARTVQALRDLKAQGPTGEEAVFVTTRKTSVEAGERLRPWSVTARVRKYVDKALLNAGLTAHKLRHAFATILLEAGADIRDVADQLGHESIESTKIYTHPTNARMKALVDAVDYNS